MRYTATMRFIQNPRKEQIVERDMMVIREDGSIGIVKAGTRLPAYDEELKVELDPTSDK